ncbi:hypothetical protein D9615_010343 [Tricholomella constricta]|uniref:Uncharacterized protein n=1 Tax=Tricholomella constricta TaxID=117010 RepID=A0A8H5LV23_9AGAR|nr:hypothetical protein D9615_010343 [Tricholomella constricta]
MDSLKGFLAVAAACFTSGLAGVYFEMVLKNSHADLWVRNVQLSLFSLLPALAPIIFSHASTLAPTGAWLLALFHNFGFWAWAIVTVQVLGGLVTAMVIKYSDNILKGFATSLSIVISFLASVALFRFKMTFTFVLGSGIVLVTSGCTTSPRDALSGAGQYRCSAARSTAATRTVVRALFISGHHSAVVRQEGGVCPVAAGPSIPSPSFHFSGQNTVFYHFTCFNLDNWTSQVNTIMYVHGSDHRIVFCKLYINEIQCWNRMCVLPVTKESQKLSLTPRRITLHV